MLEIQQLIKYLDWFVDVEIKIFKLFIFCDNYVDNPIEYPLKSI